MPRLIWVFAGRTCHFIYFVIRWLIFCSTLWATTWENIFSNMCICAVWTAFVVFMKTLSEVFHLKNLIRLCESWLRAHVRRYVFWLRGSYLIAKDKKVLTKKLLPLYIFSAERELSDAHNGIIVFCDAVCASLTQIWTSIISTSYYNYRRPWSSYEHGR